MLTLLPPQQGAFCPLPILPSDSVLRRINTILEKWRNRKNNFYTYIIVLLSSKNVILSFWAKRATVFIFLSFDPFCTYEWGWWNLPKDLLKMMQMMLTLMPDNRCLTMMPDNDAYNRCLTMMSDNRFLLMVPDKRCLMMMHNSRVLMMMPGSDAWWWCLMMMPANDAGQ